MGVYTIIYTLHCTCSHPTSSPQGCYDLEPPWMKLLTITVLMIISMMTKIICDHGDVLAPVTVALSEVARGAGLGDRVDNPRRGDGVQVGCLLGACSRTV